MKASINIVTVRWSGLEWQLKHLAAQTFKDFEVVLLDGHYLERKTAIETFSREHGLNVQHHPLPKLNYVCDVNIATNRNAALKYSKGNVVIFVDDHEMIPPTFVEKHVSFTRPGFAMAGRQIALYNKREDYEKWFKYTEDEFEHGDGREAAGLGNKFGNGGVFWTNNASVWRQDAYAINGFDERYNGGTAGEDTDFGVRLTTLGIQIFFTTECEVWHIDHQKVPGRKFLGIPDSVDRSKCNHDRAPFTCNTYQRGNPNLVEYGSLYTWRDGLDIKYFICKNCGIVGHIDSIEIVRRALDGTSVIAPPELFDFKKDEAEKVRSYVYWPIPKPILEPLVSLYEGTQYTYYKSVLDAYNTKL